MSKVSMSVEEAVKQLDGILKNTVLNMKRIGEILIKFSGDDRKALEEYLSKRQVRTNDIRAAEALATGRLDERLFFPGMPFSKLIALTKKDQARLLSQEKLPLASRQGSYEKTWAEMNLSEKLQLLGKNGIRSVAEQDNTLFSTEIEKTAICKHAVDFHGGSLYYQTKYGKVAIPLDSLVDDLEEKGALDEFRRLLARLETQISA